MTSARGIAAKYPQLKNVIRITEYQKGIKEKI